MAVVLNNSLSLVGHFFCGGYCVVLCWLMKTVELLL